MAHTWLTRSSFKFGDVDMYTTYGIMLTGEPEDVILPQKRPRKVTIPNRHGAYDFGGKYYNERGLKLPCTTVKTTRQDIREIAYALSVKSEIRIWNDPNVYYIGCIYNATELNQIRGVANEFDMVFACDPFAYGAEKTVELTSASWANAGYQGTAPGPAVITLTNVGQTLSVTNITINQRDSQ